MIRATVPAPLRRKLGDSFWGVADQGVFSATNLGVALVVARSGGADELGLWAVAVAALLLGAGLQRTLLVDPWIVHEGSAGRPLALGRLVAALVVGWVALAGIGGVASVSLEAHATLLTALAVTAVPYLAQDALRSVLLVRRGARSVAANDALTGAAQVVCALLLPGGAVGGVWAFGAGCAVGVVAGMLALRGRVSLLGGEPARLATLLRTGRWFGLASLSFMAGNQLFPFAAALAAGTAVFGSFRAAATFFIPLQLLTTGLNRIWLVELSRVRGEEDLARAIGTRSRRLAAFSLAWGIVGLAVGGTVVEAAFGPDFAVERALMAVLAASSVLQAVYAVEAVAARASIQGQRLVGARIAAAGVSVAAIFVFAPLGATGLAAAILLGQLGGLTLLRAVRLRAARVFPQPEGVA